MTPYCSILGDSRNICQMNEDPPPVLTHCPKPWSESTPSLPQATQTRNATWAPTHTQGPPQSLSLCELRPWEKSQHSAALSPALGGQGRHGDY